MAGALLQGATNHFNFKELPNSRIVLSEECYIRLSGDINLCAFSGDKQLEYGTFLYGKEIQPNVIYFDCPSKKEDYLPQSRAFDPSFNARGEISNMHNEFVNMIDDTRYDCFAHIHTHPYIGGTCRYFSNQDLRTIKTLQTDFQPSNNQKKYFFGGLLTVGPENLAETDEISFVFNDNGDWYKITNIMVFINGKEYSFARELGKPKMKI